MLFCGVCVNPKISHSFARRLRLSALLFSAAACLSAQTNAPQNPSSRTYRAPDPSLGEAARVLVMTGQVSALRDDVPWALSVGDVVKPAQIVVTGVDGYAEFQVADGSHFEVFPNSRVAFRNNAGDWRDLLDILIGKVKIQIEKLGGLPNPNKVRTPTAVISVRGTVFDVNVEDEDATTLVLVEEGQVEVRHLLKGGQGRVLNEGEWIRVFKNQPIAMKMFDRGDVMQRAMRVARDAIYQAIMNNPGGVGSSGTGAGGSPGGVHDQCPASNPNCKAPPPPPPPPPHP